MRTKEEINKETTKLFRRMIAYKGEADFYYTQGAAKALIWAFDNDKQDPPSVEIENASYLSKNQKKEGMDKKTI